MIANIRKFKVEDIHIYLPTIRKITTVHIHKEILCLTSRLKEQPLLKHMST